MRGYFVHQSIKHLKNVIQQRVWQLSTTNHSWFREVFLESIVLFLDKINAKISDHFEQFFVTKQGFFASKSTKKYRFEYNDYTTYI